MSDEPPSKRRKKSEKDKVSVASQKKGVKGKTKPKPKAKPKAKGKTKKTLNLLSCLHGFMNNNCSM